MLLARLTAVVIAALFTTSTASAAIALMPAAAAAGDDATQSPSMSVSSDVLAAGASVTVSYSNTALAGQTIVVSVDNGMPRNTQTASIEIVLDGNGSGSATWTVPSWFMAKFNAPGVAEIALAIAR
jgi:hypothetical protein